MFGGRIIETRDPGDRVDGPQARSFTLEIHPVSERLPLGEDAPLFRALGRQNER
jgi:hypothetical protein